MTNNILHIRKDVGVGHPIVLLHGMFGDGTQWDKITELLKKDYRVITVDLLGHGKSPRPDGATYSAREHVEYLRNTLESVGATKDLTVVGYSMGGAVALAYSKKFQEDIEQLYLISTPFYLQPEQMVAANYAGSVIITKASTAFFDGIERLLGSGKADWAINYSNRSKLFHKMIGANDNELEADIVRKNLEMLVRKYDFAGNLAGLTVPTTFYAGTKDTFIVQGQLTALKQFNKNMHIQSLDIIKVDHMLVQNLPKEMARLISANRENLLHVGADEGTGKPLVLLHGIESSSDYWRPLIPALAEHNRVIALDLLGFGKSPKPLNIAYSLQDQVTWVTRTLQSLGIETYDIVGHSLGGLVALAVTADNPNKVTYLTLISPVMVSDEIETRNTLLKGFRYVRHFSESSYVYAHIAQALGDKQINRYLPSLRSIENAIKNQQVEALAKKATSVRTKIMLGSDDSLIDESYVRKVATLFKNASVEVFRGVSHNFAMFKPSLFLASFNPIGTYQHTPKPPHIIPQSFTRQIVKLAMPVLWAKSVIYIIYGILLFTSLAPWALTWGLAYYVLRNSYSIIRGAFSLRNENLSYIGYIVLGIFGGIIAYGLIRHPQGSLKISVFIICAIVLINGLARLLAAFAWTKDKKLKTALIFSGSLMTLLGLLAFAGGLYSIYIIIYTIATMLIVKGLQYGIYAIGALSMAYVRGFNRN